MKNYTRYLLTSLVIMSFLVLAPSITTKASDTDLLESTLSFFLSGENIEGGTASFDEGISSSKSFWMCYIVDSSGNPVSPDAKLVSSNNYSPSTSRDAWWTCNSRLGGYSLNESSPCLYDAPWGAPFSGAFQTREAEIRTYMKTDMNADRIIQQYWGTDMQKRWVDENLFFILEPCYEFRMWYKQTVTAALRSYVITEEVHTKENAPILFGNTVGLAQMANDFIYGLSDEAQVTFAGMGVTIARSNQRNFFASGMSSGYAKAFPRMEYISSGICGLTAGSSGSGYLALGQIKSQGWGMLAISARDSGVVAPSPSSPSSSDYEGYLYTLSCSGINGSYNVGATFQGMFYAESAASGDAAWNLAQKLKSSLSYIGEIPRVVYTGTNYDMGLTSKVSVRTGCITVDPSTFYGISDISTVGQSDFQSFSSGVLGGISRDITLRTYDGVS